MTDAPAPSDADVRTRRAAALITTLAVIITLRVHEAHPSTSGALSTLAVTVASPI